MNVRAPLPNSFGEQLDIEKLSSRGHNPREATIFVGYDAREPIATYVCIHSLQKYAKKLFPLSILRLDKVDSILTRGQHELQSTEFAFSRFLVPYLSNFEGFSVFLDSDFLFKGDICDLLDSVDPTKAVSVVKHDYEPKTESKFLNQKQTKYERKNWSSLMIFNNPLCRALSPKVVNESSGLYLHRLHWLDDEEIGEIDLSWNYLVGEYPSNTTKKINAFHYTLGGPYFDDCKTSEFADLWFDDFSEMKAPIK